jgi:hypothetical protein
MNFFLNCELREDVYMRPPPLSLRVWFVTFINPFMAISKLLGLGFNILPLWSQLLIFPPALMVWLSSSTCHLVVGLLYVDDIIITGDDPEYIAFVKTCLSDQFPMSDLGPLRYFLGIEISSTREGFFLSQEKYIKDLLDRASLTDHQTIETPMELNVHLIPIDGEPLEDPTRYHHIIRSLIYPGVTRPDISYSGHIRSQFVSAPTQIYYSHLHVLRYPRGTIFCCLFFSHSSSL